MIEKLHLKMLRVAADTINVRRAAYEGLYAASGNCLSQVFRKKCGDYALKSRRSRCYALHRLTVIFWNASDAVN